MAFFLFCGSEEIPDPVGPDKEEVRLLLESDYAQIISTPYEKVPEDSLRIVLSPLAQCSGPDTVPSFTPPDTQTALYKVSGDTLDLSLAFIGLVKKFASALSIPLDDLDALMQEYQKYLKMAPIYFTFERYGQGTGVESTWRFKGIDWGMIPTAISDPMVTSTVKTVDSLLAPIVEAKDKPIVLIGFENGTLNGHVNKVDYGEATAYPAFETGMFDLTRTTDEKGILTLEGNKTGEVVTVTVYDNGDVVFESSVETNRPPHTFYVNPTTCPNDKKPQWFQGEFLLSNAL